MDVGPLAAVVLGQNQLERVWGSVVDNVITHSAHPLTILMSHAGIPPCRVSAGTVGPSQLQGQFLAWMPS